MSTASGAIGMPLGLLVDYRPSSASFDMMKK